MDVLFPVTAHCATTTSAAAAATTTLAAAVTTCAATIANAIAAAAATAVADSTIHTGGQDEPGYVGIAPCLLATRFCSRSALPPPLPPLARPDQRGPLARPSQR